MNYDFAVDIGQDASEEWDRERIPGLSRAVDKLVEFGELVGVSPEEMVVLLDSGMTMRGLLYFLVSQASPVNLHGPANEKAQPSLCLVTPL